MNFQRPARAIVTTILLSTSLLLGCGAKGGSGDNGGSGGAGAPSATPTPPGSSGSNGTLTSIEVTPTDPSIALGTTKRFTATGVYSDTTTQDISNSVTWSSSDTAVATISNLSGSRGTSHSVAPGLTTITATFDSITATTTLTVTAATLASIAVTPASHTLPIGLTQQFTATGTFTDATTQDITSSVTWSSTNTASATIDSGGLATPVTGSTSTMIQATSGSIQGSTTLFVNDAEPVSISVTPANPSIALGLTKQFTATGTYTDASTNDITSIVSWSSLSTSVATISNTGGTKGKATSASIGSATIKASIATSSGTVFGTTTLTVTAATLVSIAVTPANPSVALGLPKQFTATGTYTNASTQNLTTTVVWSSSDLAVATISNAGGSQGLASSAGTGPTSITATSGLISGNTTLTVTAAALVSIDVTPANPTIPNGLTKQFTAIGVYSNSTTQDLTTTVLWESSDMGTATISNAGGSEGLATSVAAGTTTISATSGLISGSTLLTVSSATLDSIEVSPMNPSVAAGFDRLFTATGIYSDLTTQDLTTIVTWDSSDTGKATISNAGGSQGLASGVVAGTTMITATLGLVVSDPSTLTVTSATLDSIEVTPTDPSVATGFIQQFTATGVYSDLTTQDLTTSVTWDSSDTGKATISNAGGSNGLASGVAAGSTTITATLGLVSGSTTLTVSSATLLSIGVTPIAPSTALGFQQQFAATGVYSDDTTEDLTDVVTWSSSSTSRATISNATGSHGLASSVAAGSTTITATLDAVSGSTIFVVTSATLVTIDVSPIDPSVPNGLTEVFTATGIFSDDSTQDLTSAVTWSSDTPAVATISNAAGSQGLAATVGAGSANITATLGSVVSDPSILTVTSATLSTITVTATNATLPAGLAQQYTATGHYSSGPDIDLTSSVTWSSSDTSIATISNAPGSHGLGSALTAGSATITATLGGTSGNTGLTVTAATLVSIAVTPANLTLPAGLTQQYTATGTFSDLSTVDLTASVAWSSSNTAIAAISNVSGSKGLSTLVTSGGPITISASLSGITGGTTLTVGSATLVSIEVLPADPNVSVAGPAVQLTATGHYSSGPDIDLTTTAKWSSAKARWASVNNGTQKGLVTAKAQPHAVKITAKVGTVSGFTMVHTTP